MLGFSSVTPELLKDNGNTYLPVRTACGENQAGSSHQACSVAMATMEIMSYGSQVDAELAHCLVALY